MDPQLTEGKTQANYVFRVCCGFVFFVTTIFYIKLVTDGSCATYHWKSDPAGSGAVAMIGLSVTYGLGYISCLCIKTAVQRLCEHRYGPAFMLTLTSLLPLGPIFFVVIMAGLVFGIC